jgi:hypothetical protein
MTWHSLLPMCLHASWCKSHRSIVSASMTLCRNLQALLGSATPSCAFIPAHMAVVLLGLAGPVGGSSFTMFLRFSAMPLACASSNNILTATGTCGLVGAPYRASALTTQCVILVSTTTKSIALETPRGFLYVWPSLLRATPPICAI